MSKLVTALLIPTERATEFDKTVIELRDDLMGKPIKINGLKVGVVVNAFVDDRGVMGVIDVDA